MNNCPESTTGTGWLLVAGHRIKKVSYDLTIVEGASGHIGPADDRKSPLWLLENRHLVLELEDGRTLGYQDDDRRSDCRGGDFVTILRHTKTTSSSYGLTGVSLVASCRSMSGRLIVENRSGFSGCNDVPCTFKNRKIVKIF